jgi:hypothetical protein
VPTRARSSSESAGQEHRAGDVIFGEFGGRPGVDQRIELAKL